MGEGLTPDMRCGAIAYSKSTFAIKSCLSVGAPVEPDTQNWVWFDRLKLKLLGAPVGDGA